MTERPMDLKIDSREFMSDTELIRPIQEAMQSYWVGPKYDAQLQAVRSVADLVLRNAAKAWGVTGKRVEGFISDHGSTFPYYNGLVPNPADGGYPNDSYRSATLYIADPPKPKVSAEERVKALEVALGGLCERAERARGILQRNGQWGMLDTDMERRILRGED